MIARHPIRFPAFFLAVATILAACSGGERNAALPSSLPIAETVNGERVPQVLLDALARERKLDLAIAEQRAAAISELTDYILLDQVSRAEDYAKDPQFAAQVELNRLQGNANATMSRFRSTTQVDDSVLQTEYRQQIAKAGRSEYDFRQLLFASEDDALKAAGEAMSQPFAQVFERWRKQALQARAYQRIRPNQLPPALGTALAALKSGETSKVPVHTEYGWHVLNVGAISPFVPPTFEQLKDSIRETVLNQLSQQRLKKLRDSATVVAETPAAAVVEAAAKPADAKPAEKPAN